MSKGQIARMAFMLAIAVLLLWSVWGYSRELGNLINPIEYTDDVYIDGSDFTGIANLMIFGMNGFLGVLTGIGYMICIFIISLVLLLPWGLVVAIKKSVIHPVELRVAIGTYIGVSILSLVMGLIGAHFCGVLVVTGMTLVVIIMFGLLCVLPYWFAYRRSKKAEMDYES